MDEIYGFCYLDVCDMMGFIDGIENLKVEKCVEVVLVVDGDFVGGSYVMV